MELSRKSAQQTIESVVSFHQELAQPVEKTAHIFKERIPLKTSLHQAVTDGRVHQARLLTAHISNIDTKDVNGWTPLMLTCSASKDKSGSKMMKIFLKRGAQVNYKDKMGRTALMTSCLFGNPAIVRRLISEDGLELSVQDSDGNTALMHAAMKTDSAMLNLILEKMVQIQVTVDSRNNLGYTALLLACKLGNFKSAFSLVTFGSACPYLRDTEYKYSARDWINWFRLESLRQNSKGLRFPHLQSKTTTKNVNTLPEEYSVSCLLMRTYKPMMLKFPQFTKRYELRQATSDQESNNVEETDEDQSGGIGPLLKEISSRENEHDAERERLHYFRTGRRMSEGRKREISTATIRKVGGLDKASHKRPITLQHIFALYAVDHHEDWKMQPRYAPISRSTTFIL